MKAKKKLPKKVIKKSSKVAKKGQMELKVVPLGSRVLIKPFTKEQLEKKNSFGIILPDTDQKEKSEQGIVIAVGLGDLKEGKRVALSVKVGDKVAFSKYGYDDINIDGEELYLIKEENILAILR